MQQTLKTEYKYFGKKLGKSVKGIISANNKQQAIEQLKSQRILVKKVSSNTSIEFNFNSRISDKDIFLFTKKLATMVNAGLPLFESFKISDEQVNDTALKKITTNILEQIQGGILLSKALEQYPKLFSKFYISMIKAGEITGSLDVFLIRLTATLEENISIKSGIKTALFYPIVLIIITIFITFFMLLKVVPTFEKMYKNMNVELPELTQTLINAGNFVSDPINSFGMLLGLFLGVLLLSYSLKLKKVKKYFDRLLLKLPIFGNVIYKSFMANISLLMASLVSSGVSIIDTIDVVKNTSNNTVFTTALENVQQGVLSGKPLSIMFASEPIFISNFSQLLKVAESTGNLPDMLESISKYYQEDFHNLVKILSTVIEPIMILIVGGLIGVLMLALYLPIFSAGSLIN